MVRKKLLVKVLNFDKDFLIFRSFEFHLSIKAFSLKREAVKDASTSSA